MPDYLIAWLLSAAIFLAADLVWLGVAAKKFYHRRLGSLLADKFNGPAAIAFYLVYVTGIVVFCVAGNPAWQDAALWGVLFGFFCYATYNLTNLATLREWPAAVTVVDLIWGPVVTGVTAGAAAALMGVVA